MALDLTSRFTAKELMLAAAKSREAWKKILSGDNYSRGEFMNMLLPEFTDIFIVDALEYIYRLFSMFAWLTLDANSLDEALFNRELGELKDGEEKHALQKKKG